jgi:hypothetical protein
MPILAPGMATRSHQPTLLVENTLEAGSWRFRLTVVNESGSESDPAELVVRVVQPPGPPGPIRPVDPRILPSPPTPEPIRQTGRARPVRRPSRGRRPAP